jgi:hypothetical protein
MLEGIDLTQIMAQLEAMGFFVVALPFLLVFTLFFAMLSKINLFGDDKKSINVVVSVIFAFLFVRATELVAIMNEFLPQVSFMTIALITFMLLIGMLGAKTKFKGFGLGVGFLIAAGAVLFSLGTTSGILQNIPNWIQLTQYDRNLLVFIVLVGVFIAFVTGSFNKKEDGENWLEKLGKSVGGDD